MEPIGGSEAGTRDGPQGCICQNRILAPPECWRLNLGEILDPPLEPIHQILRMGFYHPTVTELSTTLL